MKLLHRGVVLANRMLTRVRQAARREVRPTSYEAARWSAILLADYLARNDACMDSTLLASQCNCA